MMKAIRRQLNIVANKRYGDSLSRGSWITASPRSYYSSLIREPPPPRSIQDINEIPEAEPRAYTKQRQAGPRLMKLRSLPTKQFTEFLVDNYGRQHDYLRISITEHCNLRCRYCMPEEGVELSPEKDLLNTDEIIRIAKLFALSGVRKIRLTGGEPTVRKDVIDIVRRLHEIPGVEEICMTSNGLALHRKLPALFENGLTSLNLSMDTMINGKFQIITRRNGLSAVIKSLHKAIELGIRNVKINTVVMRNFNDDEVMNFVELSRDKNIEVRFIEYMPFDGNKWSTKKMVPYQDILANIRERYPGIYKLDAKPGDTAKKYHIPGFSGKIGFITSMTSDFCSSCTRLRITSDGNLKVCLFGNDELSLRDLMRSGASDEQILQKIGTAVKLKKEKHAGLDELKDLPNRPMILIGG